MSKSEMQFDEACRDNINKEDVPIGFALGLAMNEKAMERFAGMPQQKKMSIIEQSRQIESKREMERLVSRLGE